MVDLASNYGKSEVAKTPEKSYPTLYLDRLSIKDVSVGDEVDLKGQIKSVTENEDGSYSCTIKVTGMDCEECGDLDSEMDKIASKKARDAEDDEE